MRSRDALAIVAAAALVTTAWAPPAEAGSSFGLRIGGGGFGISIGIGDWGMYSNHWYDPGWSLDFDVVLDGYGEWVWVDGLGRCWRPWVAASWQPYTHGRWVHTSYGWTWVAYEPWGYVPHHYGSWARCAFGWVWVPGYTYAAANVVWVRAGSYVGWYARPPHGWSHAAHGFRQGYRHGARDGYASGYGDGYRDGWRDARYGTWVDWHHFGTDNVSQHAVSHSVASRHRVQDRAAAPSAVEVSRRGGRPVAEARLETRTVRANGRDIVIARPSGVEPSIEHHAPTTVRTALSDAAIERRQPGAGGRETAAPAARTRSSASRHESRAPRVERVPAAPSRSAAASTARAPVARSPERARTSDRAPAARAAGSAAGIDRPIDARRSGSDRGVGRDSAPRASAPAARSSRDAAARRTESRSRAPVPRTTAAKPAVRGEGKPVENRRTERSARRAPERRSDDSEQAEARRSRSGSARDDGARDGERSPRRKPVKKRN